MASISRSFKLSRITTQCDSTHFFLSNMQMQQKISTKKLPRILLFPFYCYMHLTFIAMPVNVPISTFVFV